MQNPIAIDVWDLIDGKVSHEQIAALLNITNQGTRIEVPTDPLVLDLNGDGVKLTDYSSAPVLFDADNDGGSLGKQLIAGGPGSETF